MASRTIVVGDIHGCFDELQELLDKVALTASDRVISVGDLITKGPGNREVLQLFMTDERFSAVIGNHDLAVRRRWNGEKFKLKPSQKPTHKELKKEKEKYLPFLNNLPFIIELDSHLIVHAGIRPNVALCSQTTDDLTELRSLGPDRTKRDGPPWYDEYDGKKMVLFGHWPSEEPRRGRNALGLDTGCVYGHRLTAYIIETDKLESVRARKVYDPT
jgi:diadenosine tetraphosphatase ApaH/serine/threonine PP2A family protein phosphatase